MASKDSRPGDRHTHPPVAYRVPADVRPLLDARMERTGLGPSAIITEALRKHLAEPSGRDPETAAADPEAQP